VEYEIKCEGVETLEGNKIRVFGESIEALENGEILVNGEKAKSKIELERSINILIKAMISIVEGS